MVDGAAQRLPSQRGINPIKLRKKIAAQVVVPAPIRKSNIHVGRLGDVFIGTQMRYRAHIAFCGGSEQRVLFVASGRSTQGRTWLCMVLTFPNADRIFPTFATKPAGSAVKVMYPSSRFTPSSPNDRKKSPRA